MQDQDCNGAVPFRVAVPPSPGRTGWTVTIRQVRISVVSESSWTVQDHGVHTAFVEQLGALRNLGHDVRVNSLAWTRGADLTIVHSPGPVSLLHLRVACGTAVAMAHVTPHTLEDSLRAAPMWRDAMARWLGRFYSGADVVVAVSASVAAELRDLGVARSRIVVASLGVNPPAHESLRRGTRRRRRLQVLGVGQLQPRKGISEFAAVAARCPQHDFVWAGGRPFGVLTAGGMSVRRLRRVSPPNLRFTGRLPEQQLEEMYRTSDAFLFLTRQENFGQVVVEAAHARLPLLLSRIAPFEAQFGEAALLVDRGDARGSTVADCLNDRSTLEELAQRSAAVADAFTADRAVARMLQELGRSRPTVPEEGRH